MNKCMKEILLLPERILLAKQTDATKELMTSLWEVRKGKNMNAMNIMVVGIGEAIPVANILRQVIHEKMCTSDVKITTPQTALRIIRESDKYIGCSGYDLVIGISYYGNEPDIIRVFKECMSEKHPIPFMLLTGENKANLKGCYDENELLRIVSYFSHKDTTGQEKGIMPMFSTLAPAFISDTSAEKFDQYIKWLKEGEEFVSEIDISKIGMFLKQHPIIHVLYEWETLPTACDIENKFSRLGIAVMLHEKKDFAHCGWMPICGLGSGLVINLAMYESEGKKAYKTPYDMLLAEFLRRNSIVCLDMENGNSNSVVWNLIEMSKLPYLIVAIAMEMGMDAYRPKRFPECAIDLCNYDGDF